METILTRMLSKYEIKNQNDKLNAIKEIIQEVILCGLSKAGFFNDVNFYGGTALRIFYGLDRFSEDLDFSLKKQNPDFDLSKYFPVLNDYINSLGLNCEITQVEKNYESPVKSAFLKGNTNEILLSFSDKSDAVSFIQPNAKIKIKFEVDTMPACGQHSEIKYELLPTPYDISVCDLPTLFAGKIHACLCRKWKTRIKGRDFYDFLFFISIGAKVNINYLKNKLIESDFITGDYDLNINNLRELLNKRFNEIDFEEAKMDVIPFIKDKTLLDLWNSNFFCELAKKIDIDN